MQAIERMKAALELARASGSSAVPMNPEIVSEVLAHIDALEAENERLRKDAERLDWYENNSEKVLNIGPRWYSRKLYGRPMKRRNGFRDAIDAAMKETP